MNDDDETSCAKQSDQEETLPPEANFCKESSLKGSNVVDLPPSPPTQSPQSPPLRNPADFLNRMEPTGNTSHEGVVNGWIGKEDDDDDDDDNDEIAQENSSIPECTTKTGGTHKERLNEESTEERVGSIAVAETATTSNKLSPRTGRARLRLEVDDATVPTEEWNDEWNDTIPSALDSTMVTTTTARATTTENQTTTETPGPPTDSPSWRRFGMRADDSMAPVVALACDEEDLLEQKLASVRATSRSVSMRETGQRLDLEHGTAQMPTEHVEHYEIQNGSAAAAAAAAASIHNTDTAGFSLKEHVSKAESADQMPPSMRPGAVRVAGIDANSDDLEETGYTYSASDEPIVEALPISTEDIEASIRERLMRASVEAHHVQAVPPEAMQGIASIDTQPPMGGASSKQRKRKRWMVIVGIVVLVVVVGAVVGGVLAATGSSSEQPGTLSPSLAPTASPTGILGAIYAEVALYPDQPFPGPDAPQHKAIKWLFEEENFDTYGPERLRQRYAVVTLAYGSETINQLPIEVLLNVGWFTSEHECTWFGFMCDDQMRIISFRVPNLREVTGTILPEIGLLTHLRTLLYTTTNLEGAIPSEFGFLTRMTSFGLINNALSGTVPTEVGLMTDLRTLSFSNNQLVGPIPSEIGLLSQLISLDCSVNFLTGRIPTEIGGLGLLTTLSLQSNELSGFPSELGLLQNLETLNLELNPMKAWLPTELGRLRRLRELSIGLADMQGSIPTEVSDLSELRILKMQRNSLTGRLPSELGRLQNLEMLELTTNLLSGQLPDELANMPNLRRFEAGGTDFVGTLPIGMCVNASRFETLELDCDQVVCPCCTTCCNLNQSCFLNQNQM